MIGKQRYASPDAEDAASQHHQRECESETDKLHAGLVAGDLFRVPGRGIGGFTLTHTKTPTREGCKQQRPRGNTGAFAY
jgi:hypothetical protein